MMKRRAILYFSAVLVVLTSLTACSSVVNSHRQKETMMQAYLSGNQDAVRNEIDGKLDDSFFSAANTGDEIMWQLEAGSFYFLTGDNQESFRHFGIAENLMEEYDRRAIVNMRQAAAEGSMLAVNLNTLPYRAFCRDKVLFPVYKALACLGMGNEAGFRVELFHLREIQDKVISDYQEYFREEQKVIEAEKKNNESAAANVDIPGLISHEKNQEFAASLRNATVIANKGYGTFLNPLAIFMSGYGYLRDNNLENAIVDFERLYKAMPQNPLIRKYYAEILRRTNRQIPSELKSESPIDFPLGQDNVLVIFANGRSAAFRQIALYIPVYYVRYVTLAAVAWPVCEYYTAPFQTLSISAGEKTFQTCPVADMDAILTQEYKERLPGMLTRIVLSTAAKEIASYIAIEAAKRQSTDAGLAAALATAAYKAAFNTADTRSWEILPKEFQIIQFPMPQNRTFSVNLPGVTTHSVQLSAQTRSAILFVNAPSRTEKAITYRLFEFQNQ